MCPDPETLKAAEDCLAAQGYRVVARDYRTGWGRLDFVCRDGPVLAFVQVRDPRNAKPGEAEREALSRTAADFLSNRGWWHFVCRFDAVLVSPDGRVELVRDSW